MSVATSQQKKIPRLRFPNFNSEWNVARLQDLFSEFQSGDGITSTRITELGKFPVYGGNGLRGYTDTKTHDGEYFLIGRQGALCGNVVNVKGTFYASEHAIVAKANELNNTAWLSQRLDYYKLNRLSESSAQPGLSVAKLKRLKLVVPQYEEQQKIADFLGSVDAWLDNLRQQKTALETYKRGMMQRLFNQQIRFKNDNGNDFPEWKYVGGDSIFKTRSERNDGSGLPVLAITQEQGAVPRDLIDYKVFVKEESVNNYKIVRKGDFIISLRSFQGGIEYSDYEGLCSPAYIVLKISNAVAVGFYRYYLKYPDYIKRLISKLEGIRDGKMISFKQFSENALPLPCLEEQQKIADFLSALDQTISDKAAEITRVEQWKRGLMQKMFV